MNRLFVESTDGGYTNKRIYELLDDHGLFVSSWSVIGGGTVNVAEVSPAQLTTLLNSKLEMNLKFRTYDLPRGSK